MPRNCAHSWSLDPTDSNAIPNARTVHALLRCIRRLPGAFPARNYDDLGEALAPVLEALRPRVVAAMKADIRARQRLGDVRTGAQLDFEDPLLLQHDEAQKIIGEGLAASARLYRTLSNQLDTFLSGFTARNPHPTDHNVKLLTELLSLSAAESAFLRTATALSISSIDRTLFSFIPSGARMCKGIEALSGAGSSEARCMFRVDSALPRSGLLPTLEGRRRSNDLDDLLALTSAGDRLLCVPYESAAEMAAVVLNPLPPPASEIRLAWPHLEQQAALLGAALVQAVDHEVKGVNILLHGAPGTGKTEFARQLIVQIGARGFMIDHCDDQGDEAKRSDRLASLRLSQCFAGQQQRTILVLDEAEDVFQSDYQSPLARVFGEPTESKAWINSLLESNPHPVIWISNQVNYLDPAYLRRFSFCVEFPPTPFSLRRKIAQSTLAGVGCTPETIDAVARDARTSPALLAAAAKFAGMAQASGLGADAAVIAHVTEHAKALGHKSKGVLARRTQRFDVRYLNFAGNLTPQGLLGTLKRDPAAALVFCGPPGTGKTQFAAEIAQLMDRQLVVRTASDINSKWYGESEANVAGMFRECDPKAEVLFLDEAEVLLAARDSTRHRADRAVTAEFVRWLEVFEGTFICATNHVTDFDAALMRRFAFRVEFQPMSASQKLALFAEQALGWNPDSGEHVPNVDIETTRRLTELDLLTPGDFANAARRARRLALGAPQWLAELEAEQASKGGSALRRIGFV